MKTRITLLVADDHPLFIEGVIAVIQKDKKFLITGSVADGVSALKFINENEPDIALLDVQMPGLDGLKVAEAVINAKLKTKIILLTMFNSESLIRKSFRAGIHGFVLKEHSIKNIVEAIETVYSGEIYTPVGFTNSQNPGSEIGMDILTASELKIIKLIAENKSSKDISSELFISLKTVENHRSNICKKFGLTGPTSLLKFASTLKAENNLR